LLKSRINMIVLVLFVCSMTPRASYFASQCVQQNRKGVR
jgi:hypothetical protein